MSRLVNLPQETVAIVIKSEVAGEKKVQPSLSS
jgi:hypothetical protein